jgi:transposase
VKHSAKLTHNQIQQLETIIANRESTRDEVRRAQATLLINDDVKPTRIRQLTAYHHDHAYRLRQQFLIHGSVAIIDKRKPKTKEILTRRQRQEIVETIKTKTPNECDPYFNSNYWTTGIAGAYVKRTYNVEYKSKTSLYIIFRQAKFTYHKPGRVYERRNEQEVQEWRIQAKKQVKAVWNDANAVVLTEDEMHLSTQTTVQKIWLPQGEYPKIEVASKRESRSIYGFLNIKTGQEHAFKTQWQNMYITGDILKKLRNIYPTQKLFLLWDKAGWHKGSEAQKFIKEDGSIETLYFPAAAPEENPQEHVWKNGRSQVTHNHFIADIDKATDQFVEYLNMTRFSYSLLGFSCKT